MTTGSTSCRELAEVSNASALVERDRVQELRREKANAHHHKRIWTKEPHGGQYRAARLLLYSVNVTDPYSRFKCEPKRTTSHLSQDTSA